MLGVCHQNICKEGVATQDAELRKNFIGKPEHVVNYISFVVEEVREIMADLGVTKLDDLIGRVDLLEQVKSNHRKAKYLDLSKVLETAHLSRMSDDGQQVLNPLHFVQRRSFNYESLLDSQIWQQAENAIESTGKYYGRYSASNQDRALGTYLSSKYSDNYGYEQPDDTVVLEIEGRVGQSLGAFGVKGLTIIVEGSAQDYVGKGLSGAKVVVRPPRDLKLEEGVVPIAAGNVNLYGATSGTAYFRGRVGERFAVRNSGAKAVVEGAGDHFCEYMTGGRVINLGPVGRNAFAGMSGGVVYQLDFDDFSVSRRMNKEARNSVKLKKPSDLDFNRLREMLQDYLKMTGSPIAESLLSNWDQQKVRFTKLIPVEYEQAVKTTGNGLEIE